MTPRPFIIFALPRSRTAWLGAFLTYGPWVALHEPSVAFKSVADLATLLARPYTGLVDTGLAIRWPDAVNFAPGARLVTVQRPRAEVERSLAAIGFKGIEINKALDRLQFALDEIKGLDAVNVSYSDLDSEATCRRLFEFCLGLPWDRAWWEFMRQINVQVEPTVMLARMQYNIEGLREVYGPATAYYNQRIGERDEKARPHA